jgi:hypothetical protein
MEVTPLSENLNVIGDDISIHNRRLIENFIGSRRSKKASRRELMEFALKYSTNRNVSYPNESDVNHDFADAFIIVEEMRKRALSTITLQELMKFVDTMVTSKVGAAYEKFKFADDSLKAMRGEMKSIWTNLRSELLKLAQDIRTDMLVLEAEARDASKHVTINGTEISEMKERWKQKARETSRSLIINALCFLCCAEVFVYLLYFVIEHRKTSRKIQ